MLCFLFKSNSSLNDASMQNDTDDLSMELIIHSPHCELDEVLLQCEGLTSNQGLPWR
jgi:hypothetical protein